MLVEAPDGSLVEWRSPEWMARDDFDPSVPDPLSVCMPFLDRDPEWLVLGGLGHDADAQEALLRWPDAKVVGIDPDPRAIKWQREHGWPAGALLLPLALSDGADVAKINMDTICCASMHPDNLALVPEHDLEDVWTVTLDTLNLAIGPFEDAILWLDCEGWDYQALRGAHDLLKSGRVMLVNVEIQYSLEERTNGDMRDFLRVMGYRRCLTWFRQWWGHNELWKRR